MPTIVCLAEYRRSSGNVYFDRRDLDQIFSIYSRKVAAGEWRDYAIDQRGGVAVFSIFRRANDTPLYSIAKFAAGSNRQGDYVLASGPRQLMRGKTIAEILAALDDNRLPPFH